MIGTALVCLALNIYFEARDQPVLGQIAVAHVVINRVDSPRFPNDVCSVVSQGPTMWDGDFPIRHRCQFSWYCDGMSDKPREVRPWQIAREIADLVLRGSLSDTSGGAMFYHSIYVNPDWSKEMRVTAIIGDHIFYLP